MMQRSELFGFAIKPVLQEDFVYSSRNGYARLLLDQSISALLVVFAMSRRRNFP